MIVLKLQNPSSEAETGRAGGVRLPEVRSRLRWQHARRLLPAASGTVFAIVFVIGIGLLSAAGPAFAQDRLLATVPVDVSQFAISQNDELVYSVPHLKRVQRTIIERDEIWVADFRGKAKAIVIPDKFMPVPPPVSYVVKKLTWSPDGRHIAMSMVMFTPTAEPPPRETEKQLQRRQHREQKEEEHAPKIAVPADGAQVVALFDDDGREIRVSGSNTRFLEKATDGAWLADGQTVVYLTGIGPYKIARVTPATGKTTILFGGQAFDNVVFDPARNQAFAIGNSLSVSGKPQLVQLDLIHETVQPIAPVPVFQGGLTVSANGQQVGYYIDGDTIEIHNLAHPLTPIRVQTGPGKFEFGHEGDRILFKRGSLGDSGDLIWVGLHDNSWVPILHDLEFHEFAIAPDGSAIIVMEPGKGELKVYQY